MTTRAAFGELVERWHHPLRSFVHRMLGDPARGDDLTQEIWLRVVRGLPRLAAPDRFPAWLFTLARRVVHDELRQGYRQVDTNPLDPDEQTGQAIESDDLDGLLDRLELETALTALAPHDREAVASTSHPPRPSWHRRARHRVDGRGRPRADTAAAAVRRRPCPRDDTVMRCSPAVTGSQGIRDPSSTVVMRASRQRPLPRSLTPDAGIRLTLWTTMP